MEARFNTGAMHSGIDAQPPAAAAWAAMPHILFGLRLWASVSLALLAAYWLQLDNAYWAGTSASIVAQPGLGASLRKGRYRAIGTILGALVIVMLTAVFPQSHPVVVIRRSLALQLQSATVTQRLVQAGRAPTLDFSRSPALVACEASLALCESAEACELLHRRTIRAQRVDRSGVVGITQRHSTIDEFVLGKRKVSFQAQPQSRPGLLHA